MRNQTKTLLFDTLVMWQSNRVKPFYLFISYASGCIEENNGNKYWKLVLTDRQMITCNEKLESKIYENQIYSDDNLPLRKKLEFLGIITVVRPVFHEANKCYS